MKFKRLTLDVYEMVIIPMATTTHQSSLAFYTVGEQQPRVAAESET